MHGAEHSGILYRKPIGAEHQAGGVLAVFRLYCRSLLWRGNFHRHSRLASLIEPSMPGATIR